MSFRHHIYPPVSIIVAVDEDGGFGKQGKIPWHVPEDMKHFNAKTKGGVCIMGRRTYTDMLEMWKVRESKKKKKKKDTEPKQILAGRESFVVSSNPELYCPGAKVVRNLTEAIQECPEGDTREIFVIGGFRMFVEAMSHGGPIYMTVIKGKTYDCDVKFPIQAINRYYGIVEGRETKKCRYVTYKPIRRQPNETIRTRRHP